MTGTLAPLRKVIRAGTDDQGLQREWLECGHKVARKQDSYDYTSADRRRCWKCQKGRPQDFQR